MTSVRASLLITAAFVTVLAPAARAGDLGDPAQSCDGNTYQMVECLKGKTAEWDKRMNAAYQQALKDAAGDKQRDQLRIAQRLWIQFRDANCLYYDLGEGTIARIDAGECMRSLTETRARELENIGHQ
ncbi:lysozyme inhibitor LprI family protein [Bradyrhizobium genosp. L]|uniref:lysozyme inhibitor LprI family protein n=1 Tax=Bradyrhizobium genosp. L TaxID=83637 RepID=UPI001FEFD6E6|nr:lysozyme inhibitor LprI family protein [Bradyrhizobium genosp. L]